jgi:hypothetical protein
MRNEIERKRDVWGALPIARDLRFAHLIFSEKYPGKIWFAVGDYRLNDHDGFYDKNLHDFCVIRRP